MKRLNLKAGDKIYVKIGKLNPLLCTVVCYDNEGEDLGGNWILKYPSRFNYSILEEAVNEELEESEILGLGLFDLATIRDVLNCGRCTNSVGALKLTPRTYLCVNEQYILSSLEIEIMKMREEIKCLHK